MTSDPRIHPPGFTLVELLVVMAVISIIAALAVPLYSRSVQTSRSVACVSNLRQLGVALSGYLGDHSMRMPVLQAGRSSTSVNVPVIDNTLNVYAPTPAVFACPADNLGLAASTGTSYYWNTVLSLNGGQSLASLSFLGVSNVSQIPILADKAAFHPNSENQVNLLYADGHVTDHLSFFSAGN